ncbi:hypothetical protein LTR37_007758 [Vermiconidia calcicola]|uniref:Uncharacterized protein n=1 Tax=Vermiconidia calcicola TaxID=1690605 RepID=A0ACC3ND29_9PEZI|nr:hypothetical protein LTR37_007758 [Vermiconidia calcicola]
MPPHQMHLSKWAPEDLRQAAMRDFGFNPSAGGQQTSQGAPGAGLQASFDDPFRRHSSGSSAYNPRLVKYQPCPTCHEQPRDAVWAACSNPSCRSGHVYSEGHFIPRRKINGIRQAAAILQSGTTTDSQGRKLSAQHIPFEPSEPLSESEAERMCTLRLSAVRDALKKIQEQAYNASHYLAHRDAQATGSREWAWCDKHAQRSWQMYETYEPWIADHEREIRMLERFSVGMAHMHFTRRPWNPSASQKRNSLYRR